MLFLRGIQFVKKKNENREGKHVHQKEKKFIYQLFEIYKIKMLSLQDEDVLAKETHKCPCLYRSRRPEVFLEISQIHRKTPVPKSLLKKRLWPRCFPVNFAKFQRTPFVTEHLRWLLLSLRLRPSFSSCTNR